MKVVDQRGERVRSRLLCPKCGGECFEVPPPFWLLVLCEDCDVASPVQDCTVEVETRSASLRLTDSGGRALGYLLECPKCEVWLDDESEEGLWWCETCGRDYTVLEGRIAVVGVADE